MEIDRNKVFLKIFRLLLLSAFIALAPGKAICADVSTSTSCEEMVLVPAGDFIMGLPDGEPDADVNPLRTVFLDDFYIDRCEVTNKQYRRCVSAGACLPPSLIIDYPPAPHEDAKRWYTDNAMDNYPVVGMTWKQAATYCRWLGKHLPLSSEWEKAARGADGRRYPWGNDWDPKRANWDEGGKIDGFKNLAPVGSFPQGASPYGVMDMAGNAREWVDSAVVRGGSWYSSPISLRVGDPGHDYVVERDDDMGFRCAKDAGKSR